MQPDNRGNLSLFERAMYRVSNHGLEFVPGVGFRDDGISKSMSRIPAFRGLLNGKNDFFRYGRRNNKSLTFTPAACKSRSPLLLIGAWHRTCPLDRRTGAYRRAAGAIAQRAGRSGSGADN